MLIGSLYGLLFSITIINSAKVDLCKRGGLLWAPKTYRYVYMTFLNDASCASWGTRNSVSKQPTGTDSLILPLGVPFAFACGACFPSSNLDVNLTLVSTGVEAQFEPLKSEKGLLHSNYFTECLVSYGLTAPIKDSGEIECKLNRGIKTTSEYISFSTRQVSIEEDPEIVINVDEGKVKLQCPDIPLKNKKNIVYVWHKTIGDEPLEISEIVAASLRQNVSLYPTKGVMRISCSVYDFINPYKVWRTSYVIRSEKEKETIQNSEWSIHGGIKEAITSKHKFLTIGNPAVWLIGAGILVSVVGVAVCIGYCGCTNRSKLPNLTPTSPESKSSLLATKKADFTENVYTNYVK